MKRLLFDLDTPLLTFTGKEGASSWTIRDAVEGVQIFGGIGSGKTSGSGRMLALKYLAHGFGGLVLTAKPDEKALWQEYCRLTGRHNDLIIIEPNGSYSFNFLEYISSKQGPDAPLTENIVQVLKTVIKAGEERSTGKSDDPFWEGALDMLIFNVIDLCLLAYGKVSVRQMYDIVLSAPNISKSQGEGTKKASDSKPFAKAFEAAQKNVNKQIDAWEKTLSPDKKKELEDPATFERDVCEAIPDAALLKFVDQFFADNYRNLSEKTRSIIDFSFSGFLFRLLKEPVYSLFCQHPSNVTPDDCLKGKIILINLPAKQYHKVGIDSQVMCKYIFQRTMEKRDITHNNRPVFLWADEAQQFLHEHDADYQATARSSRIATVYISQNLPNYHANMGGEKSSHRVNSFLGTLGTKIFHANADLETNKYASELIGEAYTEDNSRSATISGDFSSTQSVAYKLERMVRPEQFLNLKTGGPLNGLTTQAYIHLQGNSFPNGLNFKKINFKQDFHL